MRYLRTLLLAIGVLLAGCMGAPDLGGSSSDLVEVDGSVEPLEPVAGDEWHTAPAGCEDRLGMAERMTFRLASATDGLVAAFDATGEIVCVDTVEAVQEELEEEGEDDLADELGDRYLVAAHLATMPSRASLAMGDPSPQPNLEASSPHAAMGGSANGDPNPQPNTNPNQP